MQAERFIGRAPERLTPDERRELTGMWIAVRIYTPASMPLRRIEALGASVPECLRSLQHQGLDPREFEFIPVSPAF